MIMFLPIPLPSPAETAKDLHRQAISLARAGEIDQALLLLRKLHRAHPRNQAVNGDLIVLLTWNQQFQEAITLFEDHQGRWPDWVIDAAVNGYRGMGRPQRALDLLEDLLTRSPEDPRYQIRKALLLIDLDRFDEAEALLSGLTTRQPGNGDLWRARIYLHETTSQWFALLADLQSLLRISPGDLTARQKELKTLLEIRAPGLALLKWRQAPERLSRPAQARLLINRAAELLRWSSDVSEDFRETRLLALRALALQVGALSLVSNSEQSSSLRRQIRFDILITLRNLRRYQDVLVLYDRLASEGSMPDYVRQALADSLLAVKKPEQAAMIYQDLGRINPKNYQANLGLFYALIEQEKFSEAYRLIDGMARREPMFQTYWDSKNKYPNPRYLDLRVTALQARFYGDELQKAWQGIDQMTRHAPRNNWLLEVRAQIALARGWPGQALADYTEASLLAPESLDAATGKARALINLQRWNEAEEILLSLRHNHPRETGVHDLEQAYTTSRQATYWSDVTYGYSSGPDLNGHGLVASADVSSALIDNSWRIVAGYRHAWSEILEGEETFARTGLGAEYTRGDWEVLAYLHWNDSNVSEPGGRLRIRKRWNDRWSASLTGERFSVSTPLRALFHGIRADSLSGHLVWRDSESREIRTGLQGSVFTDGNDRIEGSISLRQRLIDIPHLDIDGRVEIYGSANRKNNVPYYSPLTDLRMEGGLHVDHVWYRWYDHLMAQQLDLGYGIYEQQGYASRWVGHVRYEQRYRFAPRLELLAGMEIGQNVYDGHAEPYRLVRFMINGTF